MLDPLALAVHVARRQRRLALEEDLHQLTQGLCSGRSPAPRRQLHVPRFATPHGLGVDLLAACQPADGDPVQLEQPGQRAGLLAVAPEEGAPAGTRLADPGLDEVADQLASAARGGRHRGERGGQMASDAIGEPPAAGGTALDDATGAAAPGDLVGHADTATQGRIGVAVGGIEEVVVLAARNRSSPCGRRRRRWTGRRRRARRLVAAPKARVDRLRRGREEVGRFRAHLVEVDVDLRLPGRQPRRAGRGSRAASPTPSRG